MRILRIGISCDEKVEALSVVLEGRQGFEGGNGLVGLFYASPFLIP